MKHSPLLLIILVFLVGCLPQPKARIDPPSSISSENQIFLLSQYAEFTHIYNKLLESSYSGSDVQDAYDSCQVVLNTIRQKEMPLDIMPFASDLIEGINKYCTGIACYSSKTFCKNDSEATVLMAQGKLILDDFLSDIEKIEIEQPITTAEPAEPTKPANTPTPDPTTICYSWNGITLEDVGTTKCVSGKIRQAYYNTEKEAFIITFSADPEALFLILFGNQEYELNPGDCIQVTGEISQSYNTPVINLKKDQSLYECYLNINET